ncbi:MAG: nuclear transport factor 2 family protein [Pedobacter sp.]|nr:MAG: nuclear transport factor 2 family protein [Pedobacter sp.]
MIIFALNSNVIAQNQSSKELQIKATINTLFEGMLNSDTVKIRNTFAKKAIMQTIASTPDGKVIARNGSVDAFIKSIGAPHPDKYDERIDFTKILIDGSLASVWTNYKFYIGDKFSHCGVNSFQLLREEDGWKIIYLIDTRRKDNCN